MKRITNFTSFLSAVFFVKAAFALTLPVRGEYRVTNGFWDCARLCYHLGDDIAGNAGDEVLSIGYGRVVEVTYRPDMGDGTGCGNYGGRVLIEYGAPAGLNTTIVALYGHLGPDMDNPADDIFVSAGDWVSEGQVIGRLGTREENGCWSPHLHLGIHRGAYLGVTRECGAWTYAGYTPAQANQPSNSCYCAILDNWYDPSEFLGVEEPSLRIVDGYVTPNTGRPLDTVFTWHLRADGGRGAPITAGVFVWNPAFQRDYHFIMDYIRGTARPFEFEHSGQVLHEGEYRYRFDLLTCAETVEETEYRSGPITALEHNEEPEEPVESEPDPPETEPEDPPEPECAPRNEICDGEDNDCDGQRDEGNITMPCSSACGPGVYVCDLGRWLSCTAPQPQAEACDGIDNNCNAGIDEGLFRPCDTMCGSGMEQCSAGAWRWCTAPQPMGEWCNNMDDDCDGDIDEDETGNPLAMACANGCGTGIRVCDLGRWLPCTAPQPRAEVCDGIDNDCDYLIDEVDCRPPDPPACTPRNETCNNMDDDCDGAIDEDEAGNALRESCWNACNSGMRICDLGRWLPCTAPQPRAEVCDGLDNDCDGQRDEGLNCGSPPPDPPPEQPLPAPVVIRPMNGYFLEVPQGEDWRNWPITLEWQPVAGAARYEYLIVYASAPHAGATAVEGQTGGTSYNFARPREDHGIAFQWQIRAVSSSGLHGAWTEPWVMGFLVYSPPGG